MMDPAYHSVEVGRLSRELEVLMFRMQPSVKEQERIRIVCQQIIAHTVALHHAFTEITCDTTRA